MRQIKIIAFAAILMIGCYDSDVTYQSEKSITDVPIIEEPTEETRMLKSIPEYENYFLKNKLLYAINGVSLLAIDIIDQDGELLELDDFFRKNGESFFTIKTYEQVENPDYDENCDPETETCEPEFLINEILTYYKQVDDTISIIDVLPTKPTLSRIQLSNENYTAQNAEYEGEMYTDIQNHFADSGIERFKMVNGYSYNSAVGLWFNVTDGRYNDEIIVRDKGLYFWPLNRTSINRVCDVGEIW